MAFLSTLPLPQAPPSLYLRLAQEAVDYTRGKVKAGTANRQEDKKRRKDEKYQNLTQGYLDMQRKTLNALAAEACKPQGRKAPEILDWDDRIRFDAGFIEKAGFGNCGELAGVAYKFLSRLPLAGLLYISLENGGNHSFVVLGAGGAFTEGNVLSIAAAKNALGPDAVICDPWVGGGMCWEIKDWNKAIDQMLQEAAPNAIRDKVSVHCMARCSHKTRNTKVADWREQRYAEALAGARTLFS